MLKLLATAIVGTVLLSACTTGPGNNTSPLLPAKVGGLPDRFLSINHTVNSETAFVLWDRAETARKQGDLQTAHSALSQALTLTPNDPVFLSRLAEINLDLNDASGAEFMATKSLNQSGVATALRYRNWLIIQYARELSGDIVGAQEAIRQQEVLSL